MWQLFVYNGTHFLFWYFQHKLFWGACPNNLFRTKNPQYVFVNERLNWSSAQRYCRQNFTDLATARTSTNWQALSSVMPSYQNLWIGVYRDLNISWSDGTLSSFYPTTLNFYIRPSVVSARCGYHKWLNKNNWFFSTCERKYPFICHKGEFSITVF
uniref:C-type lectin domain-containing protein n=1 Tax=Oryzias latipes TaxID=8090 RepID=A0A3P9MCR8_ORYLA